MPWALAFALLVVAALLRVHSAESSGLWLDEIWSVQLAQNLESAWEVLAIRQDNNHPLNTLLLSWLADGRGAESGFLFRLPAVIAGVAASAVAGWIYWPRSRATALVAMLLVGTSSLLVHYSAEARGYGFALLFATTSLLAISRDERKLRFCIAFNASVVLGMLSHFSFVHVYGAILAAWLFERRSVLRPSLGMLLRWHALPIAATLALYWVYARGLPIAGGPGLELVYVVGRAGSMAIGLPGAGLGRWIGAPLALCLALAGIAWLARRRDPRWLLYAAGIFAMPLLTIAISQPEFLAPRYFLMSVLLLLLLLAESLGEALRRGALRRTLAIALCVGFLAGNLAQTRELTEAGRGRYWRALLFMSQHSQGPALRVGSDHDIRVGVVLGFYGSLLPDGKRLAYHRQKQWPESGPEWLVLHRHGRLDPPEDEIERRGTRYRLARVFPTGELSGSHWIVYRNAAFPPISR